MRVRALPPLALAALLASCGDSASATPTPPNVILVCMDTVRADHLGCYGYDARPTTPTLDRLAEFALVFEDTSATAGWTKPSVPSFLTGTYPVQHGVYEGSARGAEGSTTDVLSEDALTLAEVFKAQGWRTAAFVRNAQLKLGNGFEQGFDIYRDKAGDAREIRWRAIDWIDESADERPFFLYLHYLDAHLPYSIPDEAAACFVGAERVEWFRSEDWRELRDDFNDGLREEELPTLLGLYDAGIRYIDDQLGLLIKALERRGIWDDTIVCVISDHGEEFLEHGRMGHGHGLYENLLRVPWILRAPGVDARRISTPVSLVDVFPTLLAAAGLPVPSSLPGFDRINLPGAEGHVFAEHKEPAAYMQSLRVGPRKLVRRFSPLPVVHALADREVVPGDHWEAELRAEVENGLVAHSVKLRDDSASDALEVKGYVAGLTGRRFSLLGLDVRVDEATEFYGEVAQGADLSILREGAPVKAKGHLEGDVLVARRVKFYPPAERIDMEVRGSLQEIDGRLPLAHVRIGGVWVEVDEDTRWDLSTTEEPPRWSRQQIMSIVTAPSNPSGLALELSCYDLGSDPGERAPAADGSGCDSMLTQLDSCGRVLAADAIHGEGRTLTRDALDELRKLGYVR